MFPKNGSGDKIHYQIKTSNQLIVPLGLVPRSRSWNFCPLLTYLRGQSLPLTRISEIISSMFKLPIFKVQWKSGVWGFKTDVSFFDLVVLVVAGSGATPIPRCFWLHHLCAVFICFSQQYSSLSMVWCVLMAELVLGPQLVEFLVRSTADICLQQTAI